MSKCLNCGKELIQKEGKKEKCFCGDSCRIAHSRKIKSEQMKDKSEHFKSEQIKSEHDKIKSEQPNPNNKTIDTILKENGQKGAEITDKKITDMPQKENGQIKTGEKKVLKYHCSICGKELEAATYGNLIHLVDVCHECCKKIKTGEIKRALEQDRGKFLILEEKDFHGEDMFFCSEHQAHCEKYCEAMCSENCHHILKN